MQQGGGAAPAPAGQLGDLCGQCGACCAGCGAAVIDGLRRTPLCTRVVALLCLAVLAAMQVAGAPAYAACSGAGIDVVTKQWWRVAAAPVVHLSFVHWLTNAYAMWVLMCGWQGDGYEHYVGTAPVAALFIVYALSAQALAVVPPVVAHYAFHSDDALNLGIVTWAGCSVGISAALFAFLTASCRFHGQNVPCCGFALGPSVFPFVMLVLVAFLWPIPTFLLGHLMGIFVGWWVDHRTFPTLNAVMARLIVCTGAHRHSSFITEGRGGPPVWSAAPGAAAAWGTAWQQQGGASQPPTFPGRGQALGSAPDGAPPPPGAEEARLLPPAPSAPPPPAAPGQAPFPGPGRPLGGSGNV